MAGKLTFGKLLNRWLVAAFAACLINILWLKIPLLHNILLASLGALLLIFPVYPPGLEARYSARQCRAIVRIVAAAEILLSFAVRSML